MDLKLREFEEAWSNWLGVKYSIMVNSGASSNYITTAIIRELKGSQIPKEDRIIVPPIGWISDVSSVINTGFKPVFVDVDLKNMAISYENIEKAINKEYERLLF